MASSRTNESEVDESVITLDCLDGKIHLEATEAILVELNHCLPPSRVYSIAFTTRIMSKLIMYCRNHDVEFVKLADPVTLYDLIQAGYLFRHKNLMDLTCQTLVSKVKRKSVKEIRNFFINNQNYDNTQAKRTRFSPDCMMRSRPRDTFIKPSNFLYVQRSPLVTKMLSCIERRTSEFDAAADKLLESKSWKEQIAAANLLSYFVDGDRELANRLEPHHVMVLFQILERCTTQHFIQCSVLTILSCLSFTGYKMTPEIIQLLVKFVDPFYEDMVHLAVFTLTNIAENLPRDIVHILNSGALERVRNVGISDGRRTTMDSVVMFLEAVCRSEDLHLLNKVDEALSTLLILIKEKIVAEHHLEHACYALQRLTWKRVLKIEKLELMWLINFFFKIIRSPLGNNCPYPGYALGVIGNIARWGTSDQIEILTSDCMIMEYLGEVIIADSKKIRKEVCQIISNIAARMEGQLLEKITARLMEPLCSLIENDEPDVKIEAACAIFNGIYGSKFPCSLTHSPRK